MLDSIVRAVKQKKELQGLEEAYVRRKVQAALKRNPKIKGKLERSKSFKEFSRSKEFKELKRIVREGLRKVYGVFQKAKKKAKKSARQATGWVSPEEHLSAHQSSLERLPHYEEIYKRLFALTGEPRAILDLGCGANPFSYDLLGCRPFYIAVDLPNEELLEIDTFLKRKRVNGQVFGLDLVTEHETLRKLHNVDVAFLFKLLDSLETVQRHISGKLLESINATWLVISFPTVSIGGRKKIAKERRAWFERVLKRQKMSWEEFAVGNETFYVVRKKNGRKKK